MTHFFVTEPDANDEYDVHDEYDEHEHTTKFHEPRNGPI